MSDEIKQEPVDNPQPAKELSADELSKVAGGFIFSPILNPKSQPTATEPTEQVNLDYSVISLTSTAY
jgi:hypothetical protein